MGIDALEQQLLLALTQERLGIILDQRGKPEGAKKHFQEAVRLRADLLQLDTTNPSRQMAYLLALTRSGKHADAMAMAAKVRPRMEKSPELMLQVARVFAPRPTDDPAAYSKAIEQSLTALELATRDAYEDATALRTDPDLVGLRKEARFQAIIARLEAREGGVR